MSFKAVNALLEYKLKERDEWVLYEVITAETLATLGSNMKMTKRISFIEERNKIYGIELQKDERSAEEIIADTFKKHGIKIKEEVEG